MIIVTGGAGFIGANLIAELNRRGEQEILIVDNLENSAKFLNLRHLRYADYMDKREFRTELAKGALDNAGCRAVFHQGACSDTMEYDGRYMMDNNFTYSKELFHFSVSQEIPFVYASSAAVYGGSSSFLEHPDNEKPLNVYGYSKLLFDQYVTRWFSRIESTVVGLRYFNVYGLYEEHKGRMASMVHQLSHQVQEKGVARLFEGSGGYGDGEQRRDFVFVEDVVDVNLFFGGSSVHKGVFNLGTGHARSFNAIARAVIRKHGAGEIQYCPFPEGLREKYQNFTEAEISRLRQAGYTKTFTTLEEGIEKVCLTEERFAS